ncbi:MAG: hypothetical protein V5A68_07775 [Candidatus Thermoplasmatota archaeon]
MSEKIDWKEKKYREVFKNTCRYVKDRRKKDSQFDISKLKKMLKVAYFQQGNDWVGKGPLNHIENSAQIAAIEHMITEWKKIKKK